ncbi:MAG: acyl-CoA thioesterase [Bryobacteraceae bacterium]
MSQPSAAPSLTVRYAETDQMGVAYYANYFVWMEVGRVELLRALGLRYRDLEGDGYLLAVAEAHCRYHQPATYDDELIVETVVERATPRLVQFGYRLLRASDRALLATGYTKHLVCDRRLRPSRLPSAVLNILKEAAHFARARSTYKQS